MSNLQYESERLANSDSDNPSLNLVNRLFRVVGILMVLFAVMLEFTTWFNTPEGISNIILGLGAFIALIGFFTIQIILLTPFMIILFIYLEGKSESGWSIDTISAEFWGQLTVILFIYILALLAGGWKLLRIMQYETKSGISDFFTKRKKDREVNKILRSGGLHRIRYRILPVLGILFTGLGVVTLSTPSEGLNRIVESALGYSQGAFEGSGLGAYFLLPGITAILLAYAPKILSLIFFLIALFMGFQSFKNGNWSIGHWSIILAFFGASLGVNWFSERT